MHTVRCMSRWHVWIIILISDRKMQSATQEAMWTYFLFFCCCCHHFLRCFITAYSLFAAFDNSITNKKKTMHGGFFAHWFCLLQCFYTSSAAFSLVFTHSAISNPCSEHNIRRGNATRYDQNPLTLQFIETLTFARDDDDTSHTQYYIQWT